MTAQNSWIFEDNFAALKAAWTAMDQTYGPTSSGMSLQWIDNASINKFPPRQAPWTYDSAGWQIAASIDAPMNGKFVVYQNETAHQVMIVAMGTNGNSDLAGWLSNAESYGEQQWTIDANVQKEVFDAADKALELVSGTKLIVAGDSKGGALAQFIVNDLVKDRADAFLEASDPLSQDVNLATLTNDNIALIARVAPGVQAQLGAGWQSDGSMFNGIQAFYSAPEMQDLSATEAVSQLGGAYLDGNGNFYQDTAGVEQNQFDYTWNGNNPLATYTYLHRIGYSGFDALTASSGDFSTLLTNGATAKGTISVAELQQLGSLVASFGQGPTVTTTEAKIRLGTELASGLALSPLAAIESLLRGAPSKVELGTAAAVMLLPGVEEGLLAVTGLGVIAANGIAFFTRMANLWNTVFATSATNGAPEADAYTAQANADGNGLTLTDNAGDSITSVVNGNSTTITLNGDETLTATSTDDGTALSTVTWTEGTDPTDPHGNQTFNAAGGSTSTYWYASGSYATTTDDGRGNVESDYYNSAGNLFAWNWTHADGTSGSGADFNTGLTQIPGSTSTYDVPSSLFQTIVNPDGSYVQQSWDPGDIYNSKIYSATGSQTSSSTNVPGVGADFDRTPGDTTSTTTQSGSDGGNSLTLVYDPNHILESDSWIKSDNSKGSDTFYQSGAAAGKVINTNGTSDTYSLYTSGVGAPQTFVASTMVSFVVAGTYDLTKNHFDSNGVLLSDQWQLADGTTGSDAFNSDGSGGGSVQHADGEVSAVTLDASGGITILNSDADGNQESQDAWSANGVYTITIFNPDDTKQVYTYQLNGTVTETDYDSDGMVTTSQASRAGAVLDPDGIGFGKIQNADGTYSVDYYDSSGDALIFKYSGSTLTGTDHVGALKASGQFGFTFTSGQTAQSPYDGYTPVVTDSDGTTQRTLYFNVAGVETGDSWTNSANGSYGYDSLGAGGATTGSVYSSDGTYYTFSNDGAGNQSTDYFDATGAEISDAWADADASTGSDTFLADGTTAGVVHNADGTSDQYSDDGQGDLVDQSFDTAGTKVADQWSKADGSSGNDSFNADGSRSGYSVQATGAYDTYTADSTGSGLQKDYTASNTLVQEVQTLADGHGNSVAYSFDTAGNALAYSLTTAGGTTESGSLVGIGMGLQSNVIASTADGDSISTPAAGGIVVAWGNNDSVTAGGGTAVVNAWGANDTVVGGSGNDTLTAQGAGTVLTGGLGNETFVVTDSTDTVIAQQGAASNVLFSSVGIELPANVDVLTLTGTADLTAYGNNDATNVITANSGNDFLHAGIHGDDTLISGSGVDTLMGGDGDETFVINNSNDEIQLLSGEGGSGDVVESSVSYTLNLAIAQLELIGSGNLAATDNYGYATLTGNSGNDTLTGGSGSDVLVSGTGVDTLVTGTGSNLLVLNNAADVIQVSAGAGVDTVESYFSYTLQSRLDTLELMGSNGAVGAGNSDTHNYISGNAGADTLIAGSGSDTLVTGTGVDTLVAGTGTDLLEGKGGDTFDFNAGFGSSEIVLSSGTGTIDFGAGISASDLTMGLTSDQHGSPALLISDGTGRITVDGGLSGSISKFGFAGGGQLTLAQLLSAAHVIDSTVVGANGTIIVDGTQAESLTLSDGNDTIFAAGSNDTIIAGNGTQALYGLGADEVLAGSTGEDSLYGGAGDDTLIAGIGYTQMQGGTGDDTFVLTEGGSSTLIPGSAPGAETIYLPQGMTIADFTGYQDGNDLILQSLSGDTTAIISGFYGAASADKTWLLADGSGVQFLANWVGGQHQAPPTTDATYENIITAARLAYAGKLGATLSEIGTQGGSIERPDQTTPTQNYQYTFTGVGIQNLTVGNYGQLSINSSDNDQKQSTYSQTEETETYSTPVYQTLTVGGGQYFLPANQTSNFTNGDPDEAGGPIQIYGNTTIVNQYDAAGNYIGRNVTVAPTTETVQTGVVTHTITVPVTTTYTNETQGFRVYNVTADDTSNNITAEPGFVGSVVLGDGDNYVDLGGLELNEFGGGYGHLTIYGPVPGAFIQAGNGNDTISGTGGEDIIAAGTGFDQLQGWQGTTYYVPMSGDSTDIIYASSAYYAYGPYAANTLELPDGVTPENLQVQLFSDPFDQYIPPTSEYDDVFDPQTLLLRYGDSTVIIPVGPNEGVPEGIGLFKFADGAVLTADQMLAIAGAAQSTDSYNPVVEAGDVTLAEGQSVIAATDLFTASDSSGSDVTWYQISDSGRTGGYFSLNGVSEGTNGTFLVSQEQLTGLVYVAGFGDTYDTVSVKGWDGIEWGSASSFNIINPDSSDQNLFTASGPDEQVLGFSSGPGTLIGGYGGDSLVGASGQDTFVYDAGSGAETISESVPVSDSSFNVLQFDAGITPGSITLSVAADGALVVTIGSSGDSVTVEGFDPTDPLNSVPIQQFQFSDGTSLSFADLLNQVAAGSGSVTGADGSVTYYDFSPGEDQIYSGQTFSADSQAGQTFLIDADGTIRHYVYDAEGRTIVTDATFTDGSYVDSTFNYNSDGSYTRTDLGADFVGGPTSETITYYGTTGAATAQDAISADGSTRYYAYDSQGRTVTEDTTFADGSISGSTYVFNGDGSYTQTELEAASVGGATTQTIWHYDSAGDPTDQDVTNPDGSTQYYAYDSQGRTITVNATFADGSISDSSYVFNGDGSYTQTELEAASVGGATTQTIWHYDSTGTLTAQEVTTPDGSTSDSTYSYNPDGSYIDTQLNTPADGSAATTHVTSFDSSGNQLNENYYTPSADGSYTDSWQTQGGSNGSYWWNASTQEYQGTWNDSSGASWTDDYQYAAGGSPGGSGVSFTETYTDSQGDQGMRQFNAITGITNLSWISSATGTETGTTTDSGFVGLQNDGELTNTSPDPSFFNPTVSPAFQSFLAEH